MEPSPGKGVTQLMLKGCDCRGDDSADKEATENPTITLVTSLTCIFPIQSAVSRQFIVSFILVLAPIELEIQSKPKRGLGVRFGGELEVQKNELGSFFWCFGWSLCNSRRNRQ